MLYGIDISNYQADIDLSRVAGEQFAFCFVKATEGSGYTSPAFADQLDAATRAGLITAAYHYQRDEPAGGQLDRIRSVVPAGVPVVIDVESGSGGVDITRQLVDGLHAGGHPCPLVYIPQWYWRQIGEPDLTGLPPLWSSRYPSTRPAPASALYAAVPASYWDGYGGLPVSVLQFADSAQVADHLVDASAFLGTREDLSMIVAGAPMPAPTPTGGDDSVAVVTLPPTPAPEDPASDPATWPHADFPIALAPPGGWHGKAMAHVITNAWYPHDPRVSGHIRFGNWFCEPDAGGDDVYPVAVADNVNTNGVPMVRWWAAHWGPAPDRANALVLFYAAPGGGSVCVEYER